MLASLTLISTLFRRNYRFGGAIRFESTLFCYLIYVSAAELHKLAGLTLKSTLFRRNYRFGGAIRFKSVTT
jgi:hypothetical protein